MSVRLGILGVGGFGRYCLEQYQQIPEVEITAIGGTNPEKYARLAATYNIPYYTTDWRELVTHPNVDIIHLATPPNYRASQAVAAAKAGKHIFCEKPLALSLEEANMMLEAAKRYDVRLGINFVMRYCALYDIVRTIAAEGLLGNPQRFVFENLATDLPAGHWFWNPQISGGIPVEHGVHFFDIFSSLFGKGELDWSGCTSRRHDVEDKWQIVLRYGQQMFGSFYHAFDKPSPLERTYAMIDFEQGALQLDGWIPERLRLEGLVNDLTAGRIADLLPGVTVTPIDTAGNGWLANGNRISVSCQVQADYSPGSKASLYAQAVRDALMDFIAWVRNPQYQPRVTGVDGRAALRVALAADALAHRSAVR